MKKLILLFFIILSLTLVSCSNNEEVLEKKDDPNAVATLMEGDIFEERARVDDGLEEVDYKERQFRVVGMLDKEFAFDENAINKGQLITDALHKRDTIVEERFNIVLTPIFSGKYTEVQDWVSKTVLSGVDEFDLLMNTAVSTASLNRKRLFQNWYNVPHVDFSKAWWAKSTVEELTYDNKCVTAISDANSTAIYFSYCMVFNKNLANAYDLGNIYDAVFSGDWTFEYFYNIVKDIYRDDDGDGFKSEGDFYGFGQGQDYLDSWLYAFDNPVMSKDEDGVPTITLKTDKINSIVDSIHDLCHNVNGTYYNSKNGAAEGIFLEKRSIFNITSIATLMTDGYRNFNDEYGLLPIPKWDKSQKDYYTTVSGGHTVMAIPKTAKDLEFIGLISEALACESYKHVTPTYYEIALKTRYLRDNESKKVLDILVDGRVYDFGSIFSNWSGFGSVLGHLVREDDDNFESFYQRKYKAARNVYKSALMAFDKLD